MACKTKEIERFYEIKLKVGEYHLNGNQIVSTPTANVLTKKLTCVED